MSEPLEFKGNKLKKPLFIDGVKELDSYSPDPGLIQAVNLAIFLKRPLLVMGEPGCGKTRLAEVIAHDLHPDDYKDYLFKWHIKSFSKAQEGIYSFDAISRLRMTSLEGKEALEKEQKLKKENREELEKLYIEKGYIQKGPLSQAFDTSTKEKPAILLIDEIDKASVDFPNDLLLELDKTTYYIKETKTSHEKKQDDAPIIIITSNNEKELPAAFLRRCLFHYIKFPEKKQLIEILEGHFKGTEQEWKDGLADQIVDAFLLIRERLKINLSEKKISTSELLDWFKVIQNHDAKELTVDGESIDEKLKQTIELLKQKGKVSIPFHQVLLKNWEAILSTLPEIDTK